MLVVKGVVMAWERQLNCLWREGLHPRAFSKLRGGQYTARTRLPSSWKGCSTQEGAGEKEQVAVKGVQQNSTGVMKYDSVDRIGQKT